MGMRGGALFLAAAAAVLIAAAPATAAVEIGEARATPPNGCGSAETWLQRATGAPPGYAVPAGGGVITSWSTDVGATGGTTAIKLGVFRATAVPGEYATIGSSELQIVTAMQLNTFPTRIPVQAGDVLGILLFTGSYNCAIGGAEPGSLVQADLAVARDVGTTHNYGAPTGGLRVNASALVEPDCDGDGFGDETQDENTNSCPPGPQASITGAPKDKVKTKKKRSQATFTFSSNDPEATFQCTLDGKQEFKACTSPLTVEVKKGEHNFSVTATDAGGNAGAAATDTWKVKRKRKKK